MAQATEAAKQQGERLPQKINAYIHAIGRRKEAIARVYLVRGQGEVIVNGRPPEEYFATQPFVQERFRQIALHPFEVTNTQGMYDVQANVKGGGPSGQLEALRLGIARALLGVDPEFRKILKDEGLLSRDARMVERKKYGLHKARRSEQFSKR